MKKLKKFAPKQQQFVFFSIFLRVYSKCSPFSIYLFEFVSVWHCVYHKISASKSLQDNEKLLSAVKSSRLLSLFEMFFNCAKDLPRSIYFMLKQICIEAIITYIHKHTHIHREIDRKGLLH